VTADS